MANSLLREITEAERRAYERDGIVCLRGVISPDVVELTRSAIEVQRENPTAFATVVDTPDLYLLIDQLTSLKNDGLRQVAMGATAEVARQLLVSKQVRWIFDQLFYKGSGHVAETPWHQDTPYGYLDGKDVVRLWVPVDPVPRETTLEVVRGSHRWNIEYNVVEKFAVLEENADSLQENAFSYRDIEADHRPALPDIEGHRDSFDIVGFAVDPGDIVAFNYDILHHAGAGVNPHDKRRAFAVIYGDEQTSIKRRPNPVPSTLEAHGITDYRDGQTIAEFPEAFPLV